MRTRIISALLMGALLIPFSGCPTTPQVSLGVWLVNLSGFGIAGVELGVDGMAQAPVPYPSEATHPALDGTISWTQVDSTFTLFQVFGSIRVEYTGTVDSSTSIINGTWVQTAGGSASGTWTGMTL